MSDLVAAARQAHFYTPYAEDVSKYCALETDIGIVASGPLQACAYPNSICPIKAAVVAAIARGANTISEVAIHAPDGRVCGCCLDWLRSFTSSSCRITTFDDAATNTQSKTQTRAELLPGPSDTNPSPFLEGDWMEPNTFKFDNTLKLPNANEISDEELCQLAVSACSRCYTPVSHFPVGAAMLYINAEDKLDIATAANIEHSRIGMGLCAERSCLCAANSKGGLKKVIKLAVCCLNSNEPGRPCGGCRQSLVEYGDFPVLQCSLDRENKTCNVEPTTSLRLLPDAFTPASLA